jgi:anaerobic selenocysteine-containing dehydrogenase
MADLHLAVRPGTDAFLLGALLATLVRSDAVDHDFIGDHTIGFDEVKHALMAIPVAAWAAAAEVPIIDIERCAAMIRAAKAMVVRVELGIQQGINSTLNSYLEKLLIMLSGSFGRKGTNQLHSWLQPLWGNSPGQRFSPTGDEVISGLLPPNSFPDAVLSDHPDRLRGVWIDSSNPANTAANTGAVERALRALELCVVVDVAMTETAQFAHYVLPAASQYEKTEFTLFNFEFPTNYFHVRTAALPPLEGTLPEPEIYSRLARALGVLPGDNALAPLRQAAHRSRPEFAAAFRAFMLENPGAAAVAALVLYHTLGQTLPDGAAAAAPLWNAALLCAKRSPQAVRRAIGAADDIPDHALGDALFDAIVCARQGTAFTRHEYDEVWSLIGHPDRKVRLVLPGMLEWLARLDPGSAGAREDFPFMLAAGQRRMFNANQIFRDPAWRRDDPDGALLINPDDLNALGAKDGDWIAVESAVGRLVARCKVDGSMRKGQLALPHGYGQSYPAAGGERLASGPRINLLTESGNRDPIAGTPYHKHVAVRLARVTAAEAASYQMTSERIHPSAAAG